MTLVVLTIIFFIFIILGLSSGIVINNVIKSRINKTLKKYNYTLVSIANTRKTFKRDKGQSKLTWKDFARMGYSTAKSTTFKEVSFNTTDNKKITSLVAIDSLLLISHKISFQVNLDTL